jgi:predicted metalloprotease
MASIEEIPMRWQGGRESENIEDRRGAPRAQMAVLGGGLGTVLFVVVALLLGADPKAVMRLVQNNPNVAAPQPGPQGQGAPGPGVDDEGKKFVSVVLAETEDVWTDLFEQMGKPYRKPTLVLFSGQVSTEGCGFASAAVGPFYCPGDEKVYLDLGFFDELRDRFRAPGEFAEAYVIAHEVGHHVQDLLGVSRKVDELRRRLDKAEANALSVRLELQADFYAGVWAHHAQKMRNILEPGDLESALRAATAIGDDRLQKEAQGYVVPDSFTHGTSEQRVRWFRRGFETGDIEQGNTFNAQDL